MEETIISISFDDGREDTYRVAYKIMRKYDLLGTIHITTGYVDNTWKNGNWRTSKGAIEIAQLHEMKEHGFEIATHSDKHIAALDDIHRSISKLQEWKLANKRVGFSLPNSKLIEAEKSFFVEGLKTQDVPYMRVGRSPKCYSVKSKFCYLLYTITKSQLFYNWFNHHSCNNPQDCDTYALFSVIVRYKDKSENIVRFISSCGNSCNTWIIIMLHGVLKKTDSVLGKDPWAWDSAEFERLCIQLRNMVDKKEIKVKPIIDVLDTKGDN